MQAAAEEAATEQGSSRGGAGSQPPSTLTQAIGEVADLLVQCGGAEFRAAV